jgi:hypothetical protein
MVTGPLRTVLWILGGLAVVWLVAGLAMLPSMGRMMSEGGGMMGGGMMRGEMMGEGMMGRGMMSMMAMMAAQFLAMLGLVGIFTYLIVDSLRKRRSERARL